MEEDPKSTRKRIDRVAQGKGKEPCEDFLFFEGRLKVSAAFVAWLRSLRLLVTGLLMMLRGIPDKIRTVVKRERTPGVIACGVNYHRQGGVDLAHFPVLKTSKVVHDALSERDADPRARAERVSKALKI